MANRTLKYEPEPEAVTTSGFQCCRYRSYPAANPLSPITPQLLITSAKLTELVKQLQACTDPAAQLLGTLKPHSLEPRDAQLVGIGC